MKLISPILFAMIIAGIVSCNNTSSTKTTNDNPLPGTYENELFSVNMPTGWVCDDSGWKGLDSMQNMVDISNPKGDVVWLHVVKTFLPIKWKDIGEAKEMAKTIRALSVDDVNLIYEIDSVFVGGYAACILLFENYVDGERIIQKQYVTYLQDSHIVMYFNEIFRPEDWDEAQRIGDAIIRSIKLKKVINPLDNDSVFKESFEKSLEHNGIPEKYKQAADAIRDSIEDSM